MPLFGAVWLVDALVVLVCGSYTIGLSNVSCAIVGVFCFVVLCVLPWLFPCFVLAVLGYCHLGLNQGARFSTRSCLRPLHSRHMLCRLLMSWFGGSLGIMWSIVQSLPSRCLLQIVQIGSRTVLA